MSGKIFKSKVGDGAIAKGARYKKGGSGLNLPLVDEMIDCFTSKENPNHYRQGHYHNLIREAELPDDFDPNLFLEGLVIRVAATTTGEPLERLEYMFNPILMGLHELGYNNFNLNLLGFPSLMWMGGGFKGGPDEFFELSYSGEVHTFGHMVERCKVDYRGRVTHFGSGAKWSWLSADGRLVYPGLEAEDTVFHFLSGCPVLWKEEGRTMRRTNLEMPVRCSYFLEKGADDVDMDYLVKEQFFERGNKLWVPDAKGGWKEVPVE